MHSLRQAKFVARLLLVWFVFSIGIASASPLVSPKAMELVCSSGGVMKLVSSDNNNADVLACFVILIFRGSYA